MSRRDDGPRLVRPDEFGDVMALVNRCFGAEPGALEARMPHCFDEAHPERHAVVERDGDVVSHVVCVPAELRVDDASVACAGLAGVATDPNHRGEGHMRRLVEFWLERLADDGVPLVELEGDRSRYGRFGWENAGRELRCRITGRSFDVGTERTDAISRYRPDVDLATIRDVHESERFRVARDERRYERLLAQTGLETLVYDGADPAYLCYRGLDPASVLEFGGSRVGVAALLGSLLDRTDEITLFSHPRHPHVPLFRDVSMDWTLAPHRKLNLLDLPATVEAYRPLLERRWSRHVDGLTDPDGAVTLAVDEAESASEGAVASAVTISYGADGVSVDRRDRTPDVSLDRRGMVDLLFGSPDVYRPELRSEPFLDAVLPLEYYFWQTETI